MLAARFGLGAHSLRLYDVLGQRRLELHVEVKDTLNLGEAHTLVTQFEEAAAQELVSIREIVTHIEPSGEAAATRQVLPASEAQVKAAIQRIAAKSRLRCEPHDIVVHRMGNELSVSFHCLYAADTSIIDAHDLSAIMPSAIMPSAIMPSAIMPTEKLERSLREQVPSLRRVVIHLEPVATEI